jgi:hypothetical protein
MRDILHIDMNAYFAIGKLNCGVIKAGISNNFEIKSSLSIV